MSNPLTEVETKATRTGTSIKSSIARHQLAIALVLAGIITNAADVWVTLQARAVESNPVVLALGWDTWILVKGAALAAFIAVWWAGRDHRHGTAVSSGPLAVGLFGLLGNASTSGWHLTHIGQGALAATGVSLLIVALGAVGIENIREIVAAAPRPTMPSRRTVSSLAFVLLMLTSLPAPFAEFSATQPATGQTIDTPDYTNSYNTTPPNWTSTNEIGSHTFSQDFSNEDLKFRLNGTMTALDTGSEYNQAIDIRLKFSTSEYLQLRLADSGSGSLSGDSVQLQAYNESGGRISHTVVSGEATFLNNTEDMDLYVEYSKKNSSWKIRAERGDGTAVTNNGSAAASNWISINATPADITELEFAISEDGTNTVEYQEANSRIHVSGDFGKPQYDAYGYSFESGSSAGQAFNGTVTNQNGDGVPDGTVVEAYGVQTTNIDPETGQTLAERAEEIRNEMRNWDPEAVGFNQDTQLAGSNGEFANTGEEYVAIHSKSAWGLSGWADTPNLGQPMVVAPADDPFIASVWDPTASPLFQDGVDSDLPGTVQDDTDIVFQQLDYSGDVVDTMAVETSNTRKSATLSNAEDHDYAEVNLPAGLYRVKAENSSFSYVMAVAPDRNPEKLTKAITEKLETKANQKAAQAARVQTLLDQNKVVKLTTTTYTKNGERGRFNFSSVPSDVDVVAVQAYSPTVDKYGIDDPQNASIQDLRDIAALEDYNGSFYITPVARDVRVPSENVTVRVVEVDQTPFMDPSRFANKSAFIAALLENTTFADTVKDTLEMNSTERADLRSNLEELEEQNTRLSDRYDELREDYEERNGVSDPSNETEIRLLRQAIRDLETNLRPDTGDTESDFSDGTVSATIPWNGDFDADAVSVVAHFPGTGESKAVPDEYVSVDKRAGQGDVLEVSEYPIPADTKMVTFTTTVSGEDGERIGSGKVYAQNPSYNGRMMDVDSISVSKLSPGPSEEVSMTVDVSDESARVDTLDATVDGPTGAVNVTTADGGKKVQFTTDGQGAYYVTLDITDTEGNTWTEGLTVKARSETVAGQPSVRARNGFTGTFAVVEGGLKGGNIDTADGAVKASAVAASDDVPSTVHFHTEEMSNSFRVSDLRVLKQSGSGEPETVRKHVKVFLHTAEISENAVIYRDGDQPLNVGSETAYGAVNCGDGSGCTIRTYTEGDGSATISVNNNPSVVESTIHWARLNIPFDVPVLSTGFPPVDEFADMMASPGGVPA